MKEQWQELKETIIEIRDNNNFNEDVYTMCRFLLNYMGVLEKQMREPTIDKIRAEIEAIERYGTVNGHDIWLRTPEEIKKEVLKIIDKYNAESEDKK